MTNFNHYQRKRASQQWRLLTRQLRQWVDKGQFQAFAAEKQHQLATQLRRLYAQMLRFEAAATLRKALGVGAVLLGLQAAPATLGAQVNFGPLQVNPFGLVGTDELHFDTFGDLDGDGDLDIVSLVDESNATLQYRIAFHENESTNNGIVPNYLPPVTLIPLFQGPDNGQGGLTNPTLGDLDGDGDLDLLVGTYDTYGDFVYFENTGTATSFSFGTPVTNPFDMQPNGAETTIVKLADMDSDGDLDILSFTLRYEEQDTYRFEYIKNNGTPSTPQFDSPTASPFGLTGSNENYALFEVGDIDNDGDLDLLAGGVYDEYSGSYTIDYAYIENVGSATTPQFAEDASNPFGLIPVEGIGLWPMLGDLDNDGDLDVMNGLSYEPKAEESAWTYQENLLITTRTFEPLVNVDIVAFPTATRGPITVEVASETPADMTLSVYTMFGTLLQQQQLPKAAHVRQSIDLAGYPAGTYILQINAGNRAWTQQVVRQ